MLAVIVFIIILGVLIFVHELGHFVTARRNGIKASEFGFGFPPRAVGFQALYENGKRKKWRIVWGAADGDDENEKKDLAEAHEKRETGGTIYSLNWIPLGGFVKIKGEDGGNAADADSFVSKSAWVRTKVLVAGVLMNFVLAWFLFVIVFTIGAPTAIDPSAQLQNTANLKIQISDVVAGSPAEKSGIKTGDQIIALKAPTGESATPQRLSEVQSFVETHKGTEIQMSLKRGGEAVSLNVTPRIDTPKDQGALGVSLAETTLVSYPWYQSIWEGLKTTISLIGLIFMAFIGILHSLIMGQGAGADVSGPVGIAVLTKQVTGLGLVYVLQFAALLSVNLGIINILPIPALDGGRILFILIEKLKGSPVSAKVEQIFHSIGFLLLIGLLVLVTFKDVLHYVK